MNRLRVLAVLVLVGCLVFSNLHPVLATACGVNSIIANTFNNDPSTSFTISGATGRAQYPSSLANIGASTLVINGPQLSQNFGGSGANDGWAFDAILAVKPQYYTPGAFGTFTLTFTISSGPLFLCL